MLYCKETRNLHTNQSKHNGDIVLECNEYFKLTISNSIYGYSDDYKNRGFSVSANSSFKFRWKGCQFR